MQIVSITVDNKLNLCNQTDQTTVTPPSVSTPLNFSISDDDAEATTPPDDIPYYDLTDKRFNLLRGKISDEDNETLKFYFGKVLGIGRHLQKHPKDVENRSEMEMFKMMLAKRVAMLRLDAEHIGLDQPCIKLLETIEKEAGIGKGVKKKALWQAKDFRKRYPYEGADGE
jgi:ribosomal protein S15P/S13E